MVVIQRSIKPHTPSGGRKKENRSKRLYERGNAPVLPEVGERALDSKRQKGGSRKNHLISIDVANIFDPKSKSYSKVKIKIVTANDANRHYVRRNVLTKGTIIDTEKGKAKITNRPGQEGQVNAVLI